MFLSDFGALLPVISGLQLLLSIVCAVICYKTAPSKGQPAVIWGFLGFFLSFIAVLIILIIPKKS
ncbi:MAG: hypothetical protein ACKVS6_02545 [Planctomycetota bacterium]